MLTETSMPWRTLSVTTQKFSNWARMRSSEACAVPGSASWISAWMWPTRSLPCSLRTSAAVAWVTSLPGVFLNLRSANSRLADRQLATADTSSRVGFGPSPLPSGSGSSVIRSAMVVSSKRMRKL